MAALGITAAGCDQGGFSGLQAEWTRQRAAPVGSFAVITASHERAVLSAKGRQVAIEPADGFCLAEESIETSGRSAFVLIGDCALDAETSKVDKGARGELQLPRGIPGFMTVSVSGASAVPLDGSDDTTLKNLGAFFETAEGRRLLGRGGDGERVNVVERRRIGDGLFVLVDDKDEQPVPLLSSRFWRSFVELNDRLAVVTMSGFRDRPLSEDDMLVHLIAQVKTLRVANRTRINEEPTVVAQRSPQTRLTLLGPAGDDDGAQKISDLEPTAIIVTTRDPDTEDAAAADTVTPPAPTARPRAVAQAAQADQTTEVAATANAETGFEENDGADQDLSKAARVAKIATSHETALDPKPRPKPDKAVTVVLDPSIERVESDNAPQRAPSAPHRPRRG
ncbi:MAG: hypothetical protein AAFV19_01480 [Pseudomonadota bacterium]